MAANPIQVIQPGPSAGQAFGKGLVDTLQPMMERSQIRSELQQALAPMQQQGFENQPYTKQLSQLLPALMGTPGGAQLAGELAPILSQRASNQAYLSYLDQQRANREQAKKPAGKPQIKNASGDLGVLVEGPEGEIAQEGYRNPEERQQRNPQAYPSGQSTTPQQAFAPEQIRPMTPEEMQDAKYDLLENSARMGKPMDPGTAEQLIQQDQANRIKQYEMSENEKQRREEHYDKRMREGEAQAINSGLLKDDYEKPIFKKFLEEGADMKNSNEQFQHAKNRFQEYKNARDTLRRSFDAPGPIDTAYRKLLGTYQSKEDIIKSLQPQLKVYKKLNLIDEARRDLADTVGLGPEDVETALYPPPPHQREIWNKFPKNPIKQVSKGPHGGLRENPFPGEEVALPPEQFQTFKDGIATHLKKYPETNLVALRGFMNQDRGFAWTDYKKAIDELVEEGRFKPDPIQQHEKFITDNPPLPGLAQLFSNLLTGTK